MLKTLLKKYKDNLKWIWIPFLLFAVFLSIAILTAYLGIRFSTSNFSATGDGKMILNLMNEFLTMKTEELKFSENLPVAMNSIFSFTWLKNTLLELDNFMKNSSLSSNELQAYNEVYRSSILLYMKIALIIIIGGIFLTNFLTSFFIYRDNIDRKLSQSILAILIDSLVISTILSLTLAFTTAYKFSPFISFAVLLLLTTTLYLIKSYIIFGRKKIKIEKAINWNSIFSAILGEFILYCVTLIIVIPIYVLLGAFVAILIWIPLFIYTQTIIKTAFDCYVDSFRQTKKNKNEKKKSEQD